jgi:hypothetical protein
MNSKEIERWFRNPSDLEVWEDIASWFHQETGHLRPGKDKPIGFHQTEEGEADCCHDAWLLWVDEKRLDAQRSLLAERARFIVALETIASPSTASMTHAGTVDTLRSHARAALRG